MATITQNVKLGLKTRVENFLDSLDYSHTIEWYSNKDTGNTEVEKVFYGLLGYYLLCSAPSDEEISTYRLSEEDIKRFKAPIIEDVDIALDVFKSSTDIALGLAMAMTIKPKTDADMYHHLLKLAVLIWLDSEVNGNGK